MFGEGYDPGRLSGLIGLGVPPVLQPPALLEETAWQADGRRFDCFGRVVHGATMARAFAESVQSPSSYSGKSVKLEGSNYLRCMRSAQQVPRAAPILAA